MRLVDLHAYWDGDRLHFDCPTCPGRVQFVIVGPGGWHRVTSGTREIATLSIDPSISGVRHGYGATLRQCPMHVYIRDGELRPA